MYSRTTPPYPYPLAPDMGAGAIIEPAQSAGKKHTTSSPELAQLACFALAGHSQNAPLSGPHKKEARCARKQNERTCSQARKC